VNCGLQYTDVIDVKEQSHQILSTTLKNVILKELNSNAK
jgi:hypothetical protein